MAQMLYILLLSIFDVPVDVPVLLLIVGLSIHGHLHMIAISIDTPDDKA